MACVIGVHPWERGCRQQLLIDLAISADTRPAAAEDDINQSVDYVAASDISRRLAISGRYRLIETLAAAIADRLLELPGAQSVNVKIRKPGAVPSADTVAVQIQRP